MPEAERLVFTPRLHLPLLRAESMPISYQVDPGRRRVSSTIHGVIRTVDVSEFINALRRDQILEFAVLADARGMKPPYVIGEDVWHIAATLASLQGEVEFGPRAIVVEDLMLVMLARMF